MCLQHTEPQELCADFAYPVELMTGTVRDLKLKITGDDVEPFSKAVRNYLARWQETDIIDFMQKIEKACKQ